MTTSPIDISAGGPFDWVIDIGIAPTSDGGFVLIWDQLNRTSSGTTTGESVYFERFDSTGQAVGGPTLLSNVTASAFNNIGGMNPSIAARADGGMLVAWAPDAAAPGAPITFMNPSNQILVQQFDASGQPTAPISLTVGDASDWVLDVSIVSTSDDGFVLTWDQWDRTASGLTLGENLYFERFDAAGQSMGGPTLLSSVTANAISSRGGMTPAIAARSDGTMLVAWTPDATRPIGLGTLAEPSNQILVQQFDASGQSTAPITITVGGASDWVLDVGVAPTSEGGFVLTWDQWNRNASGIILSENAYSQRLDAAGQPIEAPTLLSSLAATGFADPNGMNPAVAAGADGTLFLAWASDVIQTFGTFNVVVPGNIVSVLQFAANHAPTPSDDTANATTGLGSAAGNVLANDSDPDGDTLTVTGFTGGTHGTLTLAADGAYSYVVTDLSGPTGSHLHDLLTYAVSDGRGGTANADLDITLNRGPSANNDIAGGPRGAVISGNVLANDSDQDGDALAVAGVNGGILGQSVGGSYGALVLNANGSFTYTASQNAQLPNQGPVQDTFIYSESDGHGGIAQATLTITIVTNGQSYLAGTPGQTSATGNGKDVIDASLGGQTVLAGNGADTLIGGPNDILTGGNGPDLFVFRGAFGHNEITDFANADKIILEAAVFGSAANILAHAANDGHGGTIITDPHNAANSITLDHVGLNQLHASDFLLV
jgi:VCBS repeat-containing protein